MKAQHFIVVKQIQLVYSQTFYRYIFTLGKFLLYLFDRYAFCNSAHHIKLGDIFFANLRNVLFPIRSTEQSSNWWEKQIVNT